MPPKMARRLAATPDSPPAMAVGRLLTIDLDAAGRPTGGYAGDLDLLPDAGFGQAAPSSEGALRALPAPLAQAVADVCAAGSGGAVPLPGGGSRDGAVVEAIVLPRRGGGPTAVAHSLILRETIADDTRQRMIDRLAQVAAATTNLVVVTDARRRIEWVNDAFTRTTGYTLDEVRGRQPGKLLQFDGTDPVTVARIRAALDACEPVQAEILNRAKSGREYWLSLDIQPVRRADGRLDGFVAVQTDVTEKRLQSARLSQLAAEAEEARATLLAAVAALPDGFALFDAEERLVLCNGKYAELHPRVARDLVPGMALEAMMIAELEAGEYPEARGRERTWLADRMRTLRAGPGWSLDAELADGRWVRSIKSRIAGGQTIALRSEITQLKRSERAAIAHRLAAMDASRDAIAIADPDGRLTHINASLATMFGGDARSWLGQDWSLLCHPAERAAVAKAARKAVGRRGAWRGYMRGPETDGTASRQEVSLTRAPDGSFVLIARDASQLAKDLQNETALHDLLMTIASRYLNTPVDQVDPAIEAALGDVARFADADRAYLFSYDWTGDAAMNTHEWCAHGIKPHRQRLQRVPLADLSFWAEAHRAGQSIHVPDVAALPEGGALRALLEPQGIKSLIAIPIMDGDRCEGFLGFDFVRRHYRYSERERLLLSFFSEISRSLRNRARLELLSRDVSRKLRDEEERRRLQDAAAQQRFEYEARLERALVETKRLHERDRQMRQMSEMMVRALRILAEAQDPADGPSLLLLQLAKAMGTGCAALLPFDAGDEPICLDHADWWRAIQRQRVLIDYLAAKPRRLIADLSMAAMFAPLATSWPKGGLGWMATARVVPAQQAGYLLVVAGDGAGGDAETLDHLRQQIFVRFVPLLAEALRLRRDSVRARKLEQDLQQAQKMEALGTLAGSIAHEINTPMQYISDNLHFLRDSFAELLALPVAGASGAREAAGTAYLRAEIPPALEQSLAGCRRIAEIVEAVRTFAYPDLARDEDVDLRVVLEHCLVITRSAWKHDVDVMLASEAGIPLVRGGPGQISQVFVNLITNACHAARMATGQPGRVRITLATQGDRVVVHVDDNGPGVAPELRERIFDPFFTTKEVGKGTGQGLGISRRIVERYGGRIVLGDSPLGGARFTATLPIAA
ncbi:MAG: ATP-binding protein [Rhodospirillales bacterium]